MATRTLFGSRFKNAWIALPGRVEPFNSASYVVVASSSFPDRTLRSLSLSNHLVEKEEIEDHSRILSDLCQHRTRSPLLKQKGNPSELKIPFGFLIVEGAVGEKTHFSFYIGGYCEA